MATKILKYFIIPISVCIISGCTCPPEVIPQSQFIVENASSHNILIYWDETDKYLCKFPVLSEIERDESLVFLIDGGYGLPPRLYSIGIVFDDDVQIVHTQNYQLLYHNICNVRYYEQEELDGGAVSYTFTFTDADYEYAVSQQTDTDPTQ